MARNIQYSTVSFILKDVDLAIDVDRILGQRAHWSDIADGATTEVAF